MRPSPDSQPTSRFRRHPSDDTGALMEPTEGPPPWLNEARVIVPGTPPTFSIEPPAGREPPPPKQAIVLHDYAKAAEHSSLLGIAHAVGGVVIFVLGVLTGAGLVLVR